jgi:hypothetical protein
MSDEFDDRNEIYEDQQEIDSDSNLLYEMIATLKDELSDGSTLNDRYDSFRAYFEAIFDRSIDDIDDIEELISNNNTYIDKYTIIKEALIKALDNYFGITFNNTDHVYMNNLYSIYKVIYLGYVRLLCNYAIGKGIENATDTKQLMDAAININKKDAIDISYTIIGQYLYNEDEFTSENIARALELADPGNADYIYLFGESDNMSGNGVGSMIIPNVIINNEAFRLRMKYEYSHPSMKYLFEIMFNKFIN